MSTMRFMSTLRGQPTKVVVFDSSPGRAIAKKLGDGLWDERSYKSELKEQNQDETVWEVSLRRNPPPDDLCRVMPMEVVGILHHTPARY